MTCYCGCGKDSKRKFAPGHDQKLRISIEKRVGDLDKMERLVESAESFANGTSSLESLGDTVKELFARSPVKA